MYTIAKEWTFDAAHALPMLPPGHKCRNLHGHTYRVRLELEAEALTGPGFVADYTDLGPFGRWIDDHLDHRNLNEVLPVPTTAENIAAFLYRVAVDLFPDLAERDDIRLAAVTVCETPKTSATYRP